MGIVSRLGVAPAAASVASHSAASAYHSAAGGASVGSPVVPLPYQPTVTLPPRASAHGSTLRPTPSTAYGADQAARSDDEERKRPEWSSSMRAAQTTKERPVSGSVVPWTAHRLSKPSGASATLRCAQVAPPSCETASRTSLG